VNHRSIPILINIYLLLDYNIGNITGRISHSMYYLLYSLLIYVYLYISEYYDRISKVWISIN